MKYGQLPYKEAGGIPWNKLCVYIIGLYFITIKVNKENVHLKYDTMIDPVTWWFKITKYDDKILISIANLVVIAWLTRYPRPMEITHDQVSEFMVHEFIKSLIET